MKLALALLLIAAPLAAQTSSDQKIVYNVVVTLTQPSGSIITPNPTPTPTPNPTPTPDPTPTPTPTPDPTPTPTPTPSCVSNYAAAASSLNDVSTSLVQAQQIYSAALASGAINSTTFNSGTQTLAIVRLDTSDVRDLVRIAGPTDVIGQNITFVSSEVGTLSGVLGSTSQISSSLSTLVSSMQTSLVQAGKLVASTTCAQSLP